MATRSGRPRKIAAKRRSTTTEGQGRNIGPTPEAFVKKALMLGMNLGNYAAIMSTDASCPLAVLFARGMISEDQRRAGDEFFYLFWRGFAKPFAKTGGLSDRVSTGLSALPPEYDPDADSRLEGIFKNQYQAVTLIGAREYNAFAELVLNQEWPSWFFRYIGAKEPTWQSIALLNGLDALVEYRTGNKKIVDRLTKMLKDTRNSLSKVCQRLTQ